MMHGTFVSILALAILSALGCTARRGPLVVTDPDPSVKIPAFHKAARDDDLGALQQLVIDLDSEDPAVRFYSIQALQDLTGENFTYRYWDDEIERLPALKKWQQWLANRMQSPVRRPSESQP